MKNWDLKLFPRVKFSPKEISFHNYKNTSESDDGRYESVKTVCGTVNRMSNSMGVCWPPLDKRTWLLIIWYFDIKQNSFYRVDTCTKDSKTISVSIFKRLRSFHNVTEPYQSHSMITTPFTKNQVITPFHHIIFQETRPQIFYFFKLKINTEVTWKDTVERLWCRKETAWKK